MKRPVLHALAVMAMAIATAASPASAQEGQPAILRDVGFDQKLGDTVPLDIALRDEDGRSVRLADYFRGRPVVLSLVYYECPMLCTLTLNGLVSALDVLSFDPGKEFEIVTVSFEPKETSQLATTKKKAYLQRYKRPSAARGWHFLTGDAANIARLTKAVGFRYAWDEPMRQYAHPSGVMVLTPQGRIARYLYGIEYAPKDLRFALLEASGGRIGSPVDSVILYCYQYDPAKGTYSAAIMRLVRTLGLLTVLGLGTFLVLMWRRERRLPAAGTPLGRQVS